MYTDVTIESCRLLQLFDTVESSHVIYTNMTHLYVVSINMTKKIRFFLKKID
jgi:hypothetical protein